MEIRSTSQSVCWAIPVGECVLITQSVPNFRLQHISTYSKHQSFYTGSYHRFSTSLHDFIMSSPNLHTMPATQQSSLLLRQPFHCIVWRPYSHKYAFRCTLLVQQPQQRETHSTIHPTQPRPTQPRDRCTKPHTSANAWHTRRRSPSRLGLVGQTTSHITKKTQFGPIQVVPVLYRKHMASLIIKMGSRETPT